jgi:PAS domain S-box-containing protein
MIRKYITDLIVIVIVTTGIIAIGGWFADIEKINPFISSIATAKFNTSLCLILSAIALYIINRKNKSRLLISLCTSCTVIVAVIAGITVVEYLTGLKLGIAQVISSRSSGDANPGRIELVACIMFLMTSVILFQLRNSKIPVLAQVLLPLLFFAAVFIAFNYISGLGYLESMPFAVNTALTTAAGIMALCIGIYYSRPLNTLNLGFEKRIAGYFAITMFLLGIVFFSFSTNNRKLIAGVQMVDHTKDVLFKTATVLNEAQDIETATRGYLITGKEEFLEPFNRSSVSIIKTIGEVKALTQDNGLQGIRADTLLSLAYQNINLRKSLISFKGSGYVEPIFTIMSIGAEKALMDSLRKVIMHIQTAEEKLLRDRREESANTIQGSVRTIAVIQVLVFLMLIFVFVIIYKNIKSRNLAEAALRKSERFAGSVINNAASIISVRDLNGRYILLNKAAQQLLNTTQEKAYGKSPEDFFPNGITQTSRYFDEEVIREGRPTEHEAEVNFASGTRHYIVVRFPLYDESDNIYALGSMSTEITAIKQAQAIVEDANKRQQLILNGIQKLMEASLDIICVLNEEGKIIQISESSRRLLGYNADELIGTDFNDYIAPEDHRHGEALKAEVMEGRAINDFENRFLKKDGGYISLLTTAIWSKESRNYYVILKDATEKKMTARQLTQLNETLQKRAAELQASNVELERFAYVASHDLQEPLRMVSSFLQLLEKKLHDTLDDTGRKYIDFAIDGAERMKVLIQDLLQYSRVGTSKELMVDVNLEDVIKSVQALYSLAIAETGTTLTIEPLPVIKAEKAQMQQLFQNLIGNAIKYSKPGPPRIVVGCEDKHDFWQFYVKDHGIGINPKFFDKIFIIFQRLHNKTEYTGTGIGLAICKKIVERHGGAIWVESEPGKGSVFFIRLPKHQIG